MRKVFNNASDVIHLFANRVQDEARCGNVYFDEPNKIYSYGRHYLLGEFVAKGVIVINDKGYSSTTSRHISQLSQATSHLVRYYTSETDLQTVLGTLRKNAQSLKTARKPEIYIEPSLALFDRLNSFIDVVGRLGMRKDIDYKEILTLIDAIKSDPRNSSEVVLKNAKLRAKREQARLLKLVKVERREFYAHKRHYLTIRSGIDYLRISKDGTCIETSQRVDVTLQEARRVLLLIDSGRAIGETVNGHYTITACNGTLVVGCHNIERSEIEKMRPYVLK